MTRIVLAAAAALTLGFVAQAQAQSQAQSPYPHANNERLTRYESLVVGRDAVPGQRARGYDNGAADAVGAFSAGF